MTQHIFNRPVMKYVYYEQVCYERGLFWKGNCLQQKI